MRPLSLVLAALMLLGVAAIPIGQAHAGGFSVFVGTPNVHLRVGDGVRGHIFLGNRPGLRHRRLHRGALGYRDLRVGDLRRGDRSEQNAAWGKIEPRHRDRPDRPRRRLRRLHPFLLYPNGLRYGESRIERAEPAPAPPAAPPAPPPEPVAAEPPDPRGTARRAVARGIGATTRQFPVGEPLPADLPHVLLDWRYYDLPEPPIGRIYARVGRTILLITPEDRIVERIVEPG